MKNRLFTTIIAGAMILSMAACGSKDAETPVIEDESTQESTEETVGMANPWTDCTEEEAYQYGPNGFSAPEGATNVKWSMMKADDELALPGTMIQMTFDYDGLSFTAREQPVPGEDIVDISGMYYDWTVEDQGTLANWGEGHMQYKSYRYVGENEFVDVIDWFDIETGYAYSLSTKAADLDGFDIRAIAEAIYDPEKQIGANMPDDDMTEPDEYGSAFISDAANEAAPSIDITGCDTFTQIVDKKLEKGMGYANVNLDGTDVLLVSSGTFDDLEGKQGAIDAAIFMYTDDGIVEVGKVCSAGTAYPLYVSGGKLFTGSNHWVCKYALTDGKLMLMEKASVEYDTDGNGTYFYESEDGGDYSTIGSSEAEKIFDKLLEEFFTGEEVDFTVVA